MRRKLQQSLLNNNPFPSLRNNEETYFSLPWHEENNISDLCCLVIQFLYQLGLFSCCVILTLRAGCSSLSLSGEVFAFSIFIYVDCEIFHLKNKNKTMFLRRQSLRLCVDRCALLAQGCAFWVWNGKTFVGRFLGRERS